MPVVHCVFSVGVLMYVFSGSHDRGFDGHMIEGSLLSGSHDRGCSVVRVVVELEAHLPLPGAGVFRLSAAQLLLHNQLRCVQAPPCNNVCM